MTNRAVICLGSNIPNRAEMIRLAISKVEAEYPSGIAVSHIYETPAIDGVSPNYSNAVMMLDSTHDYEQTQLQLKCIEREMGRTAQSKATGIVEIDLDVVMFNGTVMRPKDFNRNYFQIGYNHIKEHSL
mgnify:FL=1